jgi:uncharacterized membrane protein (UPF0127 family)
MQNPPNFEQGIPQDLSSYLKFVYVVDGEVVHIVRVPPEAEMFAAIMKSKPLILEVDPADDIKYGYTYDGKKFTSPSDAA